MGKRERWERRGGEREHRRGEKRRGEVGKERGEDEEPG